MDLDFFRLKSDPWLKCENISIDYAILEKLENISTIPMAMGWSDLGDWNRVGDVMGRTEEGVALSSNAFSIDCKNSIIRSESPEQIVVGLGLKNIIAVAMSDAVLVADKSQTQQIKKVVETLRKKNLPQYENLPKDHRPWGWFESLKIGKNFQVKIICVNPNLH